MLFESMSLELTASSVPGEQATVYSPLVPGGAAGRAVRSLGHLSGLGSWYSAPEGLGVVMARVYVSSTIADLDRERRAVMEWLVNAGTSPYTVTCLIATRSGTAAWPMWTPATCMC
jgi:hypothetical protein